MNKNNRIEHPLCLKIANVLSPDLLKKKYVCINKTNFMHGHCYAATEALYYLIGRDESGFAPIRGKDPDGITHWWLQNKKTGEILDPTHEQYTSIGKSPPYESGRYGGFLTNKPSKRAAEIIRRLS